MCHTDRLRLFVPPLDTPHIRQLGKFPFMYLFISAISLALRQLFLSVVPFYIYLFHPLYLSICLFLFFTDLTDLFHAVPL